MSRACLVALCALLAAVQASAASYEALPPPGLVTVGSFFPDHPKSLHWTAGAKVKTVLGIHNDSPEAYNVTAIFGSLNSPADFRLYVQNFTQQVYLRDLPSGSELSFEYEFMPDARLEPRDFVVALTVVYHDNKGNYFSNTFFNSTIEIIEVKKLIDWELIFLFLILGALAAGAGYLLYCYLAPHLTSMGLVSKSKRSRRTETSKPDDADEWVKGSHYETLKKKKAASAAKRS